MAPRTRLVAPVPTRTMPSATAPGPQGLFLATLLTFIALVPFGAVLGYVLAVKFGQDREVCALLGAVLGALASLWKRRH